MSEELTPEDRARLYQFLQRRFNLSELRDLAYRLSIDFETFPHSTKDEFARELIGYCERRNKLNCLIQQIALLRESDEVVALLAMLPPCKPRIKMHIVLHATHTELPKGLTDKLAELSRMYGEEIEVIGSIQGSTHLLVGLLEKDASSFRHQALPLLNQDSLSRASRILDQGSWEEALDEHSLIAWTTLCVYLPFTRSELLRSGLRWEEVLTLIQHSQELFRRTQQDPKTPAAFHYYAGLILVKMERWADALRSFNESLALNSNFGSAYLNRGFAYEALSRYDLAAKEYDRALQSDRHLTEAYIARGAAHVRGGRLLRALHDFDQAITLNPRASVSYINKAGVLYRLKRYREALDAFDAARRLQFKDKQLYFGRGLTLARLGEDDQAVAEFTKALELDPKDARAFMARGVVYRRMKRYSSAVDDFRQAAHLGNTQAMSYIVELENLDRPTHFGSVMSEIRAIRRDYELSLVDDSPQSEAEEPEMGLEAE